MNIRVQRCDVTWNNNNDIQQTSEQQTYNRKPILSWDIVFGICAGQRSSKQLYSHWVVDTLYGWVFTKFFTNTYNISYSKFHYIINVFNSIKHHTLRSTSMWVCACLVCWCWLVCNYMARCMLDEWPLECTVDNDRYSLLLCVIFLFCAFMLFDVRCRTNCRRSSVLYGSSIDFWFVLCEHIVVFGWGCGTRANAVIYPCHLHSRSIRVDICFAPVTRKRHRWIIEFHVGIKLQQNNISNCGVKPLRSVCCVCVFFTPLQQSNSQTVKIGISSCHASRNRATGIDVIAIIASISATRYETIFCFNRAWLLIISCENKLTRSRRRAIEWFVIIGCFSSVFRAKHHNEPKT